MSLEVFLFENGVVRTGGTLADAARVIKAPTPGALVWIDCTSRAPEHEAFLSEVLQLHRLTQEDLWEDREAPKVEAFPGYLFVLFHAVRLTEPPLSKAKDVRPVNRAAASLVVSEIDCALGPGWLFTHHAGLPLVAEVREEMARHPEALARGPHVLLHALLDRAVDLHAPLLDGLDRSIEALEDESLRQRPPRSALRRLLDLRRLLHRLRRSAVHQREVLYRLARGDFERLPKDSLPFFRDVHDHYVRIADLLDDDREMLASVFEAWMSTHSFRMNEIMKLLTLMSTIMMPLTFIAGVYGMNFQVMPELHWRYGYAYAWGLMGAVAGGLLLWFKKRGWFD
jgi:magnesium transporter